LPRRLYVTGERRMDQILQLIPPLLVGAKVTAWITFASTILGAICAFAAGLGKISRFRILRIISNVYIEVFRGTSLLVQLFWLYFALPIIGIRLSPEVAGIAALGLNIGSYGAE